MNGLDHKLSGALVEKTNAARLHRHHFHYPPDCPVEDLLQVKRAGEEPGKLVDGSQVEQLPVNVCSLFVEHADGVS